MKKVRDISKWNTVTNYASVVKESDGVIVRIAYRGSSTGKRKKPADYCPVMAFSTAEATSPAADAPLPPFSTNTTKA